MKKYLLYLVTLATWCVLASEPEPSCAAAMVLYEQEWRSSPVLSWRPLRNLRKFEAICNNENEFRLYYSQMRATLESKAGNHAAALKFNDWRENNYYNEINLPLAARATPAIPYIVQQSKESNFVVVNERHHVGSDRLLTLELMKPLFAQGYRYLATETYSYQDEINDRGYPIANAGYYSNDVVYAQMLRTALKLGYEVIGYEIEADQKAPENPDDPVNRQVERDLAQAKNIIARTVENDPDAKVLVHCGYSHVLESKRSNWSPMAYFLKELTGHDPLTIEQVELSERSLRALEHPWRQEAQARGLLGGQPVVLLDASDKRIDANTMTDIEVFGIQTSYEHGRPSWMRMGGLRQPVWFETPECVTQSCILEAMDPSEDETAVPYDRVDASQSDRVALFLPPTGEFNVRVMDMDTQILGERMVSVSSSLVTE